MLIGYYRFTGKAKSKNAKWPIHVLYNFDKDWDGNIISRRALDFVLSREAHPHEVESNEKRMRAQSYRYESLDKLIEDERNAETDQAFIDKLIAAFG